MKKKKEHHKKKKKIDIPPFKRPKSINYARDAKAKGLRNYLKRIKESDENDPGFLLLNNRYSHKPPLNLCDITHLIGSYTDPRTKLSAYDRHVIYYISSLGMDRIKSIMSVKSFGSSLHLYK